jgi:hypothetical protein
MRERPPDANKRVDPRPFAPLVDAIAPLAGMAFQISASCMRAGEGTRAASPGEP